MFLVLYLNYIILIRSHEQYSRSHGVLHRQFKYFNVLNYCEILAFSHT